MLASQAAAKVKPLFGRDGAGGSANEHNFQAAWRTSIISAEGIDFPMWLADQISFHLPSVPFAPPKSSNPVIKLQEIVWDVAEWLINDFGASPATACRGIIPRAATLVIDCLNARHTCTLTSPPWYSIHDSLTRAIARH